MHSTHSGQSTDYLLQVFLFPFCLCILNPSVNVVMKVCTVLLVINIRNPFEPDTSDYLRWGLADRVLVVRYASSID